MEDERIVALYWERSEDAIRQTQSKYDNYCMGIAGRILSNHEDARECVNDTYLAAWDAIPPQRPAVLSTFLGKLTRRISIDRWRALTADKRGGSAVTVALEELEACIPGGTDPVKEVEAKELARAISGFLRTLPYIQRKVFLMRYFEMADLTQIQEEFQISNGKAKSMLHRTRKKLKTYLQEEGY
jgi:RNA polymerase sigma-70 factor (ECF subfamily)